MVMLYFSLFNKVILCRLESKIIFNLPISLDVHVTVFLWIQIEFV